MIAQGIALVLTVVLGAADPRPPAVPPMTPLPAAPAPYVSGTAGCVIPDPSGTGGCVTAPTAWLMGQVRLRFGDLKAQCWDEHAWNPTSDHPLGRACDYVIGKTGAFAEGDDVARGWLLARWFRVNAIALRVHYVIWQGRIWSWEHHEQSWRPYLGAGVYDVSTPDGGHYDHVHVSTVDSRPEDLFPAAADQARENRKP
ncbi:hypothetical protein [Cryptosporangium sp. NPDC048952]|uniref:hypothetical protein n=1 Tax=Cryptosporangium sp. NPDC048952 TaxID=3363961 RepID=UPI00372142C0